MVFGIQKPLKLKEFQGFGAASQIWFICFLWEANHSVAAIQLAASNNSCCGARPARRLRETLLTVRPLPLAPLPASATGGGRVAPHRTVAFDGSNLAIVQSKKPVLFGRASCFGAASQI